MFTFSDQDYKWCVECNANIRKDAYYCKCCRKPVGSKLLAAQVAKNPSVLVTETAHWLPNFDAILSQMPSELRSRITQADENTPAKIGLKPGLDPVESRREERNSDLCLPNPPGNAARSLIWDILVSLHDRKVPLAAVCADPRLQLLEITVGEIVAEFELRMSEIYGGLKCKHCAEFISEGDERCRFCTGSDSTAPEPVADHFMDINRFDPTLLRNILVWEVAMRRINDEPPFAEEILQRHAITDGEVEQQILKLKQFPKMVPLSRWRERMIQLGITPDYYQDDVTLKLSCDFDYFSIQDVSALARSLTPSFMQQKADYTNPAEAMIVIDHALNRWQNNRHYESERRTLLSAKALVYSSMKDRENFLKYQAEADELFSKSLPEEYRDSHKRTSSEMKDKISEIIAGKDSAEKPKGPAERLKDLEERTTELAKMRDESMERMNKLMPGFGDIFKSIGQSTNKMMEVSKRTLKGQAALENSDPAGACAEFEAAIALLGDEVFDVSRRCDLLTNLADAQFKNGDPQAAEASFQRAFEDARNLEEAQSPTLPFGNAHHRYACFLRDTEKLGEAEEHFKLATAKHAAQMQGYITKGFMAADSSTENWLIKEDYAKLLRKLGRDEEAQQMEDDSKALKAKAPATEK